MSTFLSVIKHVNTMVLQINAALTGGLTLQPVKLPVLKGMVPHNRLSDKMIIYPAK